VLFVKKVDYNKSWFFHEEGDTYANEISDQVLTLSINTSK
jgi:hypothetical protein